MPGQDIEEMKNLKQAECGEASCRGLISDSHFGKGGYFQMLYLNNLLIFLIILFSHTIFNDFLNMFEYFS